MSAFKDSCRLLYSYDSHPNANDRDYETRVYTGSCMAAVQGLAEEMCDNGWCLFPGIHENDMTCTLYRRLPQSAQACEPREEQGLTRSESR